MLGNNYEGINPEAVADQDDLRLSFLRTRDWLERNGSQFIEPAAKVLGHYEGKLITEGLPRLEYTLPADVVRAFAPDAAEVLQLGEELKLIYWQPHYAPIAHDQAEQPDDLKFEKPRCDFLNEKRLDVLESEALRIEERVDENREHIYVSDRETFADPPKSPERSYLRLAEVVIRFASQASGNEVMTQREYQAISEILGSLDHMKQAIDGSSK
jgi:hypothetical protein